MHRYFVSFSKFIFPLLLCTLLSLWSASAGNHLGDNILNPARLSVDGVGDMADHFLGCSLAGTAQMDGKSPDLFVRGEKFYGFRLYRYAFVRYSDDAVPVFKKVQTPLAVPENVEKKNFRIYDAEGEPRLYWFTGSYKLRSAALGPFGFTEHIQQVKIPEMDAVPGTFALCFNGDGTIDVYYAKVVSKSERPGDWRSDDYRPYDATGVYRGGERVDEVWTFRCGTDILPTDPHPLEGSIYTGIMNMDWCRIGGKDGLVVTNRDGGYYFYIKGKRQRITGTDGNALRHPTINACAVAYPSMDRKSTDLVASGEGGVFYSRAHGGLSFSSPVPALEQNPALYAGSLPTPTICDWDGDGVLDMVVGNSAGYIRFFKNIGTDAQPSFLSGVNLKAGGYDIHVQPGYGEDIQGPVEARWGYVGANVYDWNGDGTLDILTNDSRAKHMVYLAGPGGLAPEHPLYLNDRPLHGMWRCRPGVGVWNGRTAYVTLDDDDEIHLYWREDDYNLEDGFKLKLKDGRTLKANWLGAGGKGRVRFEIVDWDGDGVTDLLLSTNMHNMIPADDPAGLPWGNPKELKGATILFLRNCGSDSKPQFEFPRQPVYKGELLRLGHHGCGLATGYVGELVPAPKKSSEKYLRNIIVADERGIFYLLERKYITYNN
ncbi:MAG: VCBS repeat-containing protein [Bacteroidales bacterium]|nr:VCBS repeat-containing protein [Bacteroidales bacterium]